MWQPNSRANAVSNGVAQHAWLLSVPTGYDNGNEELRTTRKGGSKLFAPKKGLQGHAIRHTTPAVGRNETGRADQKRSKVWR